MQRKTIEKVIKTKFDAWVKSIEDEDVKRLVKKNTIITGGCITSMFLNEDVSDFDVYFTDRKTVIKVADYYIKQFNKRANGKAAALATDRKFTDIIDSNKQVFDGKDCDVTTISGVDDDDLYEDEKVDDDKALGNLYGISQEMDDFIDKIKKGESVIKDEDRSYFSTDFNIEEELLKEEGSVKIFIKSSGEAKLRRPAKKEGKFFPVYLTDNSITLADDIQIIIRFFGDAKEIHKNFDYVHCTNYWDSKTRKLHTNVEALECILSKTLMYRGSKFPLCSIIRSRKFINRGWKINAGQYLKMVMQLNELDLKDINVLREQLIGVDVAFFNQFLHALEAKTKLDNMFDNKNDDCEDRLELDTTFIMELIDRIFDGDQEAEKNNEGDE